MSLKPIPGSIPTNAAIFSVWNTPEHPNHIAILSQQYSESRNQDSHSLKKSLIEEFVDYGIRCGISMEAYGGISTSTYVKHYK